MTERRDMLTEVDRLTELASESCRSCGCHMADHNDPRQGGECTNCGACDGWL